MRTINNGYYAKTYKEIAEILGITVDQVRDAERRGLKKLHHPKHSLHEFRDWGCWKYLYQHTGAGAMPWQTTDLS